MKVVKRKRNILKRTKFATERQSVTSAEARRFYESQLAHLFAIFGCTVSSIIGPKNIFGTEKKTNLPLQHYFAF